MIRTSDSFEVKGSKSPAAHSRLGERHQASCSSHVDEPSAAGKSIAHPFIHSTPWRHREWPRQGHQLDATPQETHAVGRGHGRDDECGGENGGDLHASFLGWTATLRPASGHRTDQRRAVERRQRRHSSMRP
ncbi:unnamed protein product [Vitrella brassicaformis CCMP3155]|uniref:Uncharacterized protein n=1 Tax=Vitrella brassicaformis (strain CCMP3155) TaxID=1169540 RepID=A0A0G4FNS6_VITBC|nr:unnamed protein product [Vitrella brassicaformis CCMP3155]|eukprot:CEM15837.1 unnamed protein product [Vitrella brassicaformis CCMP3155]